ncbi:MAG: HAD-IA family hydrolase [Gammaproteobacteria bacterium]|nr:HAD-IA family hydrolase [Gammaproteobacteria bacterium]MDX2460971.1 HAD-IA family hydrolase [Gammaproteobacteria bacterium]
MQAHSRIQAVTFDAAGTLIRVADPVGETYSRIARDMGASLSAAALDAAFRDVFPSMPAMAFPDLDESGIVDAERAWWRDLVERVVRHAGGIDELDSYFETLFRHYARACAWRVYPDSLRVLRSARARGLRVAVVSNFDSRLLPILRELGIEELTDGVVYSTGCGAAKPDRRIFDHAMDALGSTPETTLHVGDNLHADYHGASGAGMTAVYLNRHEKAVEDNIASVRHLGELDAFFL